MMRDERGEEDDATGRATKKKKKKSGGPATEQRPRGIKGAFFAGVPVRPKRVFVLPVRELREAGESARAKTERERASRRNRAADSDTHIHIKSPPN